MTLAAFFMASESAPLFLTDVLITQNDQGEFTGNFRRWYNGPSTPTYGFKEVDYVRKIKIIKENYCVAWSASDVDDALEAVSNLDSLINYHSAEDVPDQIGKFFDALTKEATYKLILVGIFDNNGKKQAQCWSNAEQILDTEDTIQHLTGSGVKLLTHSEVVPEAFRPSKTSLDFAVAALMTCLINEIINPHFNKYRTGAYYELTYFEDGWKNISVPINILKIITHEGEQIARLVSYSRIHYNSITPLCISMDPFDFVVKGNSASAISARLLDPFMDETNREIEFDFLDVLKEPSNVNITLVIDDKGVRAFCHEDPVLDFSQPDKGIRIHESVVKKIWGN